MYAKSMPTTGLTKASEDSHWPYYTLALALTYTEGAHSFNYCYFKAAAAAY